MSSSSKSQYPNTIEMMRWEGEQEPTLEQLLRLLEREGLVAARQELPGGAHSPEVIYEQSMVCVVVSGHVQYSFPGYGVIELHPGDILEVQPNTLHDVMVAGTHPAVLLQAFRSG